MCDAVALWRAIVTLDALYLGIRYKKQGLTDIEVMAGPCARFIKPWG